MGGVEPADLAQVMIIAAILQELGDGHLGERGRCGGVDKFQKLDPLLEPPGRHPAHPITG